MKYVITVQIMNSLMRKEAKKCVVFEHAAYVLIY
jgi:hypothetical protein